MRASTLHYGINRAHKRAKLVSFTLLQLLQHNIQLGAAVKFSLLSSQWFIFGVRQKFTVITLFKTVLHYRIFLEVVKFSTGGRRRLLFVNERRYTSMIVGNLATSIGEAFVMGRWIGGSLTNFKKLWFMYYRLLRGKDSNNLTRFALNLKQSLRGLFVLKSLPGLSFFNSVKHSYWGTGEARAMFVPSGGVIDTDAYPSSIMFPIPGNDDAFGAIYFLNRLVAKVVLIAKITSMVRRYVVMREKLGRWRGRFWRTRRRRANYKPRTVRYF